MPKIVYLDTLPAQNGIDILENQSSVEVVKITSDGNYEESFLRMGYGSAQPNINPLQIENIRIIIPPMKIIDNFIRFSDSIFDVMLDNDSTIKKIVEIRNLLLPRLMSGELSVS